MSNRIGKKRILISLALIVASVCLVILYNTTSVHADAKAQAYELVKYKQVTNVRQNHEYDVTLEMTINAPKSLQSVTVNLPSGKYKLSDVKASGCNGQLSSDSNGNSYIRVTPTDSKVSFKTGKNVFRIRYTIREYKENNTNYDMFLYDVLSSNWNVPMTNLDLTINFPDNFDTSDLQYYAGQYGAQDATSDLKAKLTGKSLHFTGTHILQNFGITVKAQLKDGYWQNALDNAWTIPLMIALLGIVTALIFLLWVIGGRDYRIAKTEEKTPIDGLTPADIGYLFYGRTRIKDIAVLLVYLASKGYMKIVEYAPKKFTLIKMKEPKDEERYIRMAYNILFEDVYEGRALEPKKMQVRLRTVRKTVETSIENGFGAKDMKACTRLSQILRLVSIMLLAVCMGSVFVLTQLYSFKDVTILMFVIPTAIIAGLLIIINNRFDSRYETDLKSYHVSMVFFLILYVALVAVQGFLFWRTSGNFVVGIVAIAAALISLVFILIMRKRGSGNAKLVTRILCLRDHIGNATASELARDGLITPDYYYSMLPYALSFSQEEVWARKFRWIGARGADFFKVDPYGNTMATDITMRRTEQIARDLKNFCRTVESDYHMMNRKRRLF